MAHFLTYLLHLNKVSPDQAQRCWKRFQEGKEKPLFILQEETGFSPQELQQHWQEYRYKNPQELQKKIPVASGSPILTPLENTIISLPLQTPQSLPQALEPSALEKEFPLESESSSSQEPVAQTVRIERSASPLRPATIVSIPQALQVQEKVILGAYEVLEKLGQGGMGVVYKVRHEKLQQIYVLKALRTGRDASSEELKRFHQEAQTCAKLKHPGIVQVFDSGEFQGLHYFVMEYIEGKTLEQYFQERPPRREGLRILQKVLVALDFAHQHGIIHRDIKPANIFITQAGEPKVGDFGLAKKINGSPKDKGSVAITQEGHIMGSPFYMSPEQIRGESSLDGRTDIYSLGVCLYVFLTQRFPFEGQSIHELFYAICEQELPSPLHFCDDLHPDLALILYKALKKYPQHRYESAFHFAEDLRCFLEGYPISLQAPSLVEKIQLWKKQHPFSFRIFCFLALLLTLALSFSLFSSYHRTQKALALRSKRFQESFTSAFEEKERTIQEKEVSKQSKGERSEKLIRLLKAFSHAKLAKEFEPEHPQAEEVQWKLGEQIIAYACANELYFLAYSLFEELAPLQFASSSQKEELKAWIEREEKKQTTQHLQRLEWWKPQLQNHFSLRLQEQFIFEVSKMKEKTISLALQAILQEAVQHFQSTSSLEGTLNPYYESVVLALGRLKAPESIALFEQGIQVLFSFQQEKLRSKAFSTSFLIALIQAWSFSGAEGNLPLLQKIRSFYGQDHFFWQKTKRAYTHFLGSEVGESLFLNEMDLLRKKVEEFLKDNQNEAALEAVKKAFQEKGEQADFYQIRAQIRYQMKEYQRSVNDLNQAIVLDSEKGAFYENRGLSFIALKEWEKAERDFQEALKRNPKNPYSFYHRGIAFLRQNLYSEALKQLDQSLSLAPHYVEAYIFRAEAKEALEDRDGALEDLDHALSLTPHPLAFLKRGVLQAKQKNFLKALSDYHQGLAQAPEFAELYVKRASVKQELGDIQGAFEDYQKALQRDPQLFEAYLKRAYLWKEQKKFQESLADLERALKLQPKESAIFSLLAEIYSLQQHYEEALRMWNQAILLDPQNAKAYYSRGNLWTQAFNQIPKALNDYQKAYELDPQLYPALFNQGALLLRSKEREQAKGIFRLYLQRIVQVPQSLEMKQRKKQILETFPELQESR
jgi:serine/threonine protein kinase/tetratricopeptide (TPR) repeat protein